MFTCLTTASALAEPVVENVRAAQRAGTNLVDLYYDLSGAESDGVTVSVELSDDRGGSYALSVPSLSGAVGAGVTNGPNRHIVWHAGVDAPDFASPTMRFRITADAAAPPGGLCQYLKLTNQLDGVQIRLDSIQFKAKYDEHKASREYLVGQRGEKPPLRSFETST